MSQLPTPTAKGGGYAPAGVTQFSIFFENRVGKMLEMVKAFDEAMVRICAMSVHDSSDHAVLRLVSNNAATTRHLLRKQDLTFIELEIMVVCLEGDHNLSRMCQYLLGAELNIRFTYPLMGWTGGCAAIALSVDDLTLAAQILRRKEFRLLAENDLPKWED